MTDEEVMRLVQEGSSPLNKARRIFSFACAAIDQAGNQNLPASSIQIKRLEFEAVRKIVAVFGIIVREDQHMPNLCIDCQHIENRHTQRYNLTCRHPVTLSPVDGKSSPELCHIMRAEGHPCGPDGKLFEPAPELPEERR